MVVFLFIFFSVIQVSDLHPIPAPRQLVGVMAEWFYTDDYSNWMVTTWIGPIRLTEDPAGLPYKLSSRFINKGFQ
jgi:hypothetical protein